MRLIVQIPCYNEEATLPLVGIIPRSVPGIDEVAILVVDDGSTDRTAVVAAEFGVDCLVAHQANRGPAAAFQTGLKTCLQLGVDIIVNTDGDNQYPKQDIPRLVQPILEGRADMVVADRQVATIESFPRHKRLLQKFGIWVIRRFAGAQVPDAPSGFRAFTREVAQRLNVVSIYRHALETLIQAGRSRMTIVKVPVHTNPKTRESRLTRSIRSYNGRSAGTILHADAMNEPLKSSLSIGSVLMLIGMVVAARWLDSYFQGLGAGRVGTVVLAAALIFMGFQVWVMGLLASLIAANRRMLEQVLYRVKRIEQTEGPWRGAGLARNTGAVERRAADLGR